MNWIFRLFRICRHDWARPEPYNKIVIVRGKFYTNALECTKCGKIKIKKKELL